MAWQTIASHNIYEYEQEEVIEKQLIAGEDGVVSEQDVVTQEYVRLIGRVIIQQDINIANNTSNFNISLVVEATAGEKGEGFTAHAAFNGNDAEYTNLWFGGLEFSYNTSTLSVAPGETKTWYVRVWDTTQPKKVWKSNDGAFNPNSFKTVNNLDGSFAGLVCARYGGYDTVIFNPQVTGGLRFEIRFNKDGSAKLHQKSFISGLPYTPIQVDRGTIPVTANNFTDETNAAFNYTVTTGYNLIIYPNSDGSTGYLTSQRDTVTRVQAALSFDGVTPDIDYRDISLTGSSYTFNFTDAERELLRVKAQGSSSVPIYYLTKTTRTVSYGNVSETREFVNSTERLITIVGCQPTLNPTVRDVNSDTLALTGNENIFVRYESMVEFSTGAVASKHATIVSQSVQCGSKTVYNLYNGVIADIETGEFIFNATDSRGLHADQVVITNTGMIEYIKPTCKQEVEINISGETGAVVTLKVSGNYFNGSFGAANNTLKLEVRYKQGNGTMGQWTTLTGTPKFNGNTYELTTTFTGLSYEQSYTFQCRATDKLNFVETSQYTIRLLPVFDWSETDFNFNVPVNIDAEDLSMHGKTIIRHGETTNNTVLSASGGHIYIRPKGTDNTSGEAIMYSNGDMLFNGNVDVGGNIDINGSLVFGGNELADFVIETGEEAMGTNGTWYWRKWASGKSEAWGCRNFGNTAVTTAWGNLYRSAIFTQDLPEDVFIRTPDSININIVHGNYGGWICKHEQTAPSAVTTGSFIWVRPASATVSPTNIGFYIVGEWK